MPHLVHVLNVLCFTVLLIYGENSIQSCILGSIDDLKDSSCFFLSRKNIYCEISKVIFLVD